MTEKKRQRIMFAVLIVSVIFGLVMKPWERRVRVIPPPDPSSVSGELIESVAPAMTATIDAGAEWPDRNPFLSPKPVRQIDAPTDEYFVPAGSPPLTLQGVYTVDGRMACVINGESCSIGARVQGWVVESIDEQGVWVSQGGGRHFVPLP
jgi:hypothetical protein